MSKSTKQVPLPEASNKQLRTFATAHLGLPLGPGPMSNKQLIAKIQGAAWDKPHIIVPIDEAAEVEDRPAAAPPAETKLGEEPYVKLLIAQTEEEDGKEHVFVGVNGRAIYLPRGEEISVKYRYYIALKNAQKQITDQRGEGVHTEDVKRIVQQYPFSVIEMPPAAVVEAWLAADAGLKAA